MQYRTDPKSGNQLSVLGFGCMRFARGLNARIDIDKAEKLVLSAIERGVNYFDTAYLYGGSERTLGEISFAISNKIARIRPSIKSNISVNSETAACSRS